MSAARVDLFDSTYTHFRDQVLEAVRQETFLQEIGQNSWLTLDEYERFIAWLDVSPEDHVLEVACGSGGPALHLIRRSGCRIVAVDVNAAGITAARESAVRSGLDGRADFRLVDAAAPLPFENDGFDSILCIDSMNHLADRTATLREWRRVLRPGGRALFTDPVVVTGPVTNDELALRSSIGPFLFVPTGMNEHLITDAGFRLLGQQDVTENAALVSARWHASRGRHRQALIEIEGEERYEGLQAFFRTVHRLTSERRLSRMAYLVEKPASG